MTSNLPQPAIVEAITLEVLPTFGLAYAEDGERTACALTKSTPGPGLQPLQPGQRLRLTLDQVAGFSMGPMSW
jgi:hypothetical protein